MVCCFQLQHATQHNVMIAAVDRPLDRTIDPGNGTFESWRAAFRQMPLHIRKLIDVLGRKASAQLLVFNRQDVDTKAVGLPQRGVAGR